jgi:hypothetical protein
MLLQLLATGEEDLVERLLSTWGQANIPAATIHLVLLSVEETLTYTTINQPRGTVWLCLESLCQLAYCHRRIFWVSTQGNEQGLLLAG